MSDYESSGFREFLFNHGCSREQVDLHCQKHGISWVIWQHLKSSLDDRCRVIEMQMEDKRILESRLMSAAKAVSDIQEDLYAANDKIAEALQALNKEPKT
jgi:hypothetical protein